MSSVSSHCSFSSSNIALGPTRSATRSTVRIAHTRYINNWDLVDSSAEHIVGAHGDPRRLHAFEQLARSDSLWERRIAMLATFHWIKQNEFGPALRVAQLLLSDSNDLIHKAVGWMLREIGKRDLEVEEQFLREHLASLPRTTLRYAIERLPERRRKEYLRGDVREESRDRG